MNAIMLAAALNWLPPASVTAALLADWSSSRHFGNGNVCTEATPGFRAVDGRYRDGKAAAQYAVIAGVAWTATMLVKKFHGSTRALAIGDVVVAGVYARSAVRNVRNCGA